jgi:ABC-type branched-subunit amino acid transport system ATPase component
VARRPSGVQVEGGLAVVAGAPGDQQMLAIGRALMSRPKLLLGKPL